MSPIIQLTSISFIPCFRGFGIKIDFRIGGIIDSFCAKRSERLCYGRSRISNLHFFLFFLFFSFFYFAVVIFNDFFGSHGLGSVFFRGFQIFVVIEFVFFTVIGALLRIK